MIELLTQTIKKHPEWLRSPGQPLSFLKTNTISSGRDSHRGKVLIFVFEQGQITPTLCIKTTRIYSTGEMIRRNHQNLKLLTTEVGEEDFGQMFAKPLGLYDDGEVIFCIETVCRGMMFSTQTLNEYLVIEKYIAWQAQLAKTSKNFWHKKDIQNFTKSIIETLELSEESSLELYNYCQKFLLETNIRLPVLVQHGDMTPDNVLVSGENVYLIDYDFVGADVLPGFDLFNFLLKLKQRTGLFRSCCDKYLPLYFKSIGAQVESIEALLFIYYLQEARRKKGVARKKSGAEIIFGYENLINKI